MTSAEIRNTFFDFFREKQHTIVPSASLMPQSPGLLFTNAGMNQFVPYFLGTEPAPYDPPRAADTQKCIRAGGKHNDLDDVGYDSYHHTLFEMLGNWSFGDYFKHEAISWAWELIVTRLGFPANRLYATVYRPDPAKGDPGSFDQEAYDVWAKLFESAGLDPRVHIVDGNVKDNFWMMGDTGPCGPCSELHVDLTPDGDSKGQLVNGDTDRCMEIWNLVFIQFNAEADGTFRDLPARHVDTGMGFERLCAIIQNTKGFTDFSGQPSNYATDVFTPIFRKLEDMSGLTYQDIYLPPETDRATYSTELKQAVAFRVIADHLRTLAFSIADGILPGNNGRNYVLRRILRRAVRYGRELGFSGQKPFFGELVGTLIEQMGDVFPELRERAQAVRATLEREEASFNETLDRGLKRFEDALPDVKGATVSGEVAFELYDTFGFPIDLTQLLCSERGLKVNMTRFEELMDEQRERARAARKSDVVRALDIATDAATGFIGFEESECRCTVLEIHNQDDLAFVITGRTPFYAEMGGQMGDTGQMIINERIVAEVSGVQQIGKARAHIIPAADAAALTPGDQVTLRITGKRRRPIEAHHTATHLLHWALHEVVSTDATQQGSLVDVDRLRFDFSSAALTKEQTDQIENLVNQRIKAADPVSWKEVPHTDVKDRSDVMQFFGDKYGETVRVVQIGGQPEQLDGYSMELCGGTHVRNTSDIGIFKIGSEGAIAAGIRRIEAFCGDAAWAHLREVVDKINSESDAAEEKLAAANKQLTAIGEAPVEVGEMPRIMAAMLTKGEDVDLINRTISNAAAKVEEVKQAAIDAEKHIKKLKAGAAAKQADAALAVLIEQGGPIVTRIDGDPSLVQELLNGLKKRQFADAAFLIIDDGSKLHLAAYCGPDAQAKGLKAGNLLRELAAIAGGKGGGKPDQARGAAPQRDKAEALETAAKQAL
ncbi:MAG: alanine--tRNA ligase [Verrucomicrobiales bacterium]|nr:alanine--tRNA ligase [Verrucomicrobiota bacterium JB025]